MIPAKYLLIGIIQSKGYKFIEESNAMARFKDIKKSNL